MGGTFWAEVGRLEEGLRLAKRDAGWTFCTRATSPPLPALLCPPTPHSSYEHGVFWAGFLEEVTSTTGRIQLNSGPMVSEEWTRLDQSLKALQDSLGRGTVRFEVRHNQI